MMKKRLLTQWTVLLLTLNSTGHAQPTAPALNFTPGPLIRFSTNSRPTDVAVADFDQDGRPDVAITQMGHDTLAIFKQRPGGTFPAHADSRFRFPNGPISVVALPLTYGPAGSPPPPADALAVYSGAYVYYLDNFHNAQGTLTPRPYYLNYASGYVSPLTKARLFAARLDGDAYVDLAAFIDTAPHLIGGITFPGDYSQLQTFVQSGMVTLPNPVPSLSLADFFQLGRLDAIVPDPVLNLVYVIPNLTGPSVTGQFWYNTGIQSYPSGGMQPVGAAAADVDGDGAMDLAAAHATSRNVVIALGPWPSSVMITLPLPASAPQQVELTDLNGDGRPDVVVLTANGVLWLYRNTGLPGAAAIDPQPVNLRAGAGPAYLRIADVNNDGRPDLLVPATGDATVSIFYNQSTLLAAATARATDVRVYPNPAVAELRLQSQGSAVASAALLDVLGRPVRCWTAPAGRLPVEDLPRGLYLLRITTAAGVVTKRVLLR